jgi:hypothetical protein
MSETQSNLDTLISETQSILISEINPINVNYKKEQNKDWIFSEKDVNIGIHTEISQQNKLFNIPKITLVGCKSIEKFLMFISLLLNCVGVMVILIDKDNTVGQLLFILSWLFLFSRVILM